MLRSILVAALVPLALSAAARGAAAQIAVMGNTVHERSAAPGEGYTGTVLVHNPTARPQIARVYQTDYSFAANGSSDFGEPGALPRSNARWVDLPERRITLPPGATVPVHYAVLAPQDTALAGSYWSMVMVEGVAESASAPTGKGVGLVPVIRYGIQIVTHLQREGERRVAFAAPRLAENESGRRTLSFEIHNEGGQAFRPKVRVELYGPSGELAAKIEQERGILYPGSSMLQEFDVTELGRHPFQALVLVDAGRDQLFGAQFALKF